jgi:diguanylate cyclase (GGDEF)-like protein
LVLAYGIASVTDVIPWRRASLAALGIGTVATIPVVGLAVYLSGASISYIEPLLVCSLLYIAFFFPPRWAWVLSAELIIVAGAPLLYDDRALQHAYPPRYMATVTGFLAVTWVMLRLKRRLVEAEAHQRDIAHRDPLTGVGNRRAFDVALERELAARMEPGDGLWRANAEPLALFVFDLDGFKAINDTYGHQAGDRVLCRTAERVREVLDDSDTLARIGGDEFAVIAPSPRPGGARSLARRIAAAAEALDVDSAALRVRASIGWATFPQDGGDIAALLGAADRRMLRAKGGSARSGHLGSVHAVDAAPWASTG